jgi:glycosyltransferase involved in cell wall biosynthesis
LGVEGYELMVEEGIFYNGQIGTSVMATQPPTLEDAQREIDRLQALVQVNAQSALLQATRASEALTREATISQSMSWRVTAPFRIIAFLVTKGPAGLWAWRKLTSSLATHGFRSTAKRLYGRVCQVIALKHTDAAQHPIYRVPLRNAAATVVAPRVLIIAELSVTQCAKYRVWQKQELLALLGTDCTVLDWHNMDACRSALQVHAVAIFYRVPGFPNVLSLIKEAERLRVATFWEADDLIFDMKHYLQNRNLETLEPALRREVLSGVELYRKAMLACRRTIASTTTLAELMRAAGASQALVIENCLDSQTSLLAAAIRGRNPAKRETVVIVYGSGSKAHDIDLSMAATAIAELMRSRHQLRLRLIGEVAVPSVLLPFLDRIEKLPMTSYPAYLDLLAEADIAIAPLEPSTFNDAKSNIKFIEASALGLPSVCSDNSGFRGIVFSGVNGFLASNDAEWLSMLARLVDDKALRQRLGSAALQAVTDRYAPDVIATTQVKALTAGLELRSRPRLRVLAVNIFFAPRSFGGATIVAEEMAKRLHDRADADVFVFTSREAASAHYTLLRYDSDGIPVIGVGLPHLQDPIADFDNPLMESVFTEVLRAVEPDVVHLHSLQGLSSSIVRSCQARGIPYVVTVHDAWWLCPRQFMVRDDGSYCFQTKIDSKVCRSCMPGALYVEQRYQILQQRLLDAAFVLSPSESHRLLHIANGLSPDRVLVNRNGVRMPEKPRQRYAPPMVRFGYVGGNSKLKGFHLIRKAFEAINESNYELIIVDNTLNLGHSSVDVSDWTVAGRIKVAPAFTQDQVDHFFDTLDVLLFPSQWKESFGLIVAEALARDVWVVVTEGVGAAEFVVHRENGTIIPLANDPRPLRDAILGLLSDRQRLSVHVNKHKRLLPTYDMQADELIEILSKACGRATQRASSFSSQDASQAQHNR